MSGEHKVNVRCTSGERQVNVKSQSELDIGGRETCQEYFPSIVVGVEHYVTKCCRE